MRRSTGLVAWKTTITPLLLLSSMMLSSVQAAAADNHGGHDVRSLLSLISADDDQLPDMMQTPRPAGRLPSPPSSHADMWRRYPQLTKLAPLLREKFRQVGIKSLIDYNTTQPKSS